MEPDIQSLLAAWGECINGGLPGGFGNPNLFRDDGGGNEWCPAADTIEDGLRILRRGKDGLRMAESLWLHYGSCLILDEQARKLRMTRRDYELFLQAAERRLADILLPTSTGAT